LLSHIEQIAFAGGIFVIVKPFRGSTIASFARLLGGVQG
jgi:hypothetical protein